MKTMELYTTAEIAAILKVSIKTISRWRDQGLPFKRYGAKTFRYELAKVNEWLEKRNQPEQEAR